MSEETQDLPVDSASLVIEAPATPVVESPATSEAQVEETPNPTEDEPGGTAEKPKQGKNYAARRIDELTRDKHEAIRREQFLMQQLAAQKPAPQVEPVVPAGPQRTDFDDYEEYLVANSKFVAKQEAEAYVRAELSKAEQARTQQTAQEKAAGLAKTFTEKVRADAKDIPDFASVVESSDLPVGNAGPAIAHCENPGKVLHYLAKNEAVTLRIGQMEPLQAAIEIGKISAALATKVTQVSNAPAPGKPVSGKTTAGGWREGMSMEEYAAFRSKRK